LPAGENEIRVINEHQQMIYEGFEKKYRDRFIQKYSVVLEQIKTRTELNILDIGGASGYFAKGIYEYFKHSKCKIVVLDTIKNDTWETFSDEITFIQASACDIDTLFAENTFDIVFANRVYHHLVKNTYKKTVEVLADITGKIHRVLKPDGKFCIIDHFYNGLIYDRISSKLIYVLTSCKIPLVVKICKYFGAESSGVGVCFLSKKMYLELLKQNSFAISYLDENKNQLRINKLKKYALCIQKVTLDNTIVCEKQSK